MDNEIKTGKWMRYQMAMDDWLVIRAADGLNWVDEIDVVLRPRTHSTYPLQI
jgi:hypothetical protein